jgi:hypothetical protein
MLGKAEEAGIAVAGVTGAGRCFTALRFDVPVALQGTIRRMFEAGAGDPGIEARSGLKPACRGYAVTYLALTVPQIGHFSGGVPSSMWPHTGHR